MLDLQLVERILSKLALTYGVRANDQYRDMDADMVRANWALEMDGVSVDAIRYACAHLPEHHPPNVIEFRKLCQGRRSEHEQLRLPPPTPDPPSAGMRARMAAAMAPLQVRASTDPRAWARRLRQRELACERLTPYQREAWRDALAEPPPPRDAE